jgi:hypothetical protein
MNVGLWLIVLRDSQAQRTQYTNPYTSYASSARWFLQESTTGTGAKPVAKSFRFLQHFISFIIIHEPSSESHISGMIPDTQVFLFRFLCNRMSIDKSRTSAFLLNDCVLKYVAKIGEKPWKEKAYSIFINIFFDPFLILLSSFDCAGSIFVNWSIGNSSFLSWNFVS